VVLPCPRGDRECHRQERGDLDSEKETTPRSRGRLGQGRNSQERPTAGRRSLGSDRHVDQRSPRISLGEGLWHAVGGRAGQ
jgi:hypothetical protein